MHKLHSTSALRALTVSAAVFAAAAMFGACGGDQPATETASTSQGSIYDTPAAKDAMAQADAKAEGGASGIITAEEVKLGADIDQGMVARGKSMSELKCQSCHSFGDNRVVGPGWKGITERRQPEWIMNMVVHTDKMLETDPEAQKMLEQCLVRMPNQGLTVPEARDVLEFMRTLK